MEQGWAVWHPLYPRNRQAQEQTTFQTEVKGESSNVRVVQTNLCTKQKQMHKGGIQTFGDWRGKLGRGINCGFGMDIYTLPSVKQMTNKALLYSPGNSTQRSVMTCVGKRSNKGQMYVYVQLIHFVVE